MEMDILKLVVCSKDMPLKDRVLAGQRYVNNGGNSGVKEIYLEIIKEYNKEIK
jgi:hypothetical protein